MVYCIPMEMSPLYSAKERRDSVPVFAQSGVQAVEGRRLGGGLQQPDCGHGEARCSNHLAR